MNEVTRGKDADSDADVEKTTNHFCDLCKLEYVSEEDLKEHQWSLLHHKRLDKENGRDFTHECTLCTEQIFGLLAFTRHIHSDKHQKNLQEWKRKRQPEPSEIDLTVTGLAVCRCDNSASSVTGSYGTIPLLDLNSSKFPSGRPHFRGRYPPPRFRGNFHQQHNTSRPGSPFYNRPYHSYHHNPPSRFRGFQQNYNPTRYPTQRSRTTPDGSFSVTSTPTIDLSAQKSWFNKDLFKHRNDDVGKTHLRSGTNTDSLRSNQVMTDNSTKTSGGESEMWKGQKGSYTLGTFEGMFSSQGSNDDQKRHMSGETMVRSQNVDSIPSSSRTSPPTKAVTPDTTLELSSSATEESDDITDPSSREFNPLCEQLSLITKNTDETTNTQTGASQTKPLVKRLESLKERGRLREIITTSNLATSVPSKPFVRRLRTSRVRETPEDVITTSSITTNYEAKSGSSNATAESNVPVTTDDSSFGSRAATKRQSKPSDFTKSVIELLAKHKKTSKFRTMFCSPPRQFSTGGSSGDNNLSSAQSLTTADTGVLAPPEPVSKPRGRPKESRNAPLNIFISTDTEEEKASGNERKRGGKTIRHKKKKAGHEQSRKSCKLRGLEVSDVSNFGSPDEEDYDNKPNRGEVFQEKLSSKTQVKQEGTELAVSTCSIAISQETGSSIDTSIELVSDASATKDGKRKCQFKYKDGKSCHLDAEKRFCRYHQNVLKAVHLHITTSPKPDQEVLSFMSDSSKGKNSPLTPPAHETERMAPAGESYSCSNSDESMEQLKTTCQENHAQSLMRSLSDSARFKRPRNRFLGRDDGEGQSSANEEIEEHESVDPTSPPGTINKSRFKYLNNLSKKSSSLLDLSKTSLPPNIRKLLTKRYGGERRARTSSESSSGEAEHVAVTLEMDSDTLAQPQMNSSRKMSVSAGIDTATSSHTISASAGQGENRSGRETENTRATQSPLINLSDTEDIVTNVLKSSATSSSHTSSADNFLGAATTDKSKATGSNSSNSITISFAASTEGISATSTLKDSEIDLEKQLKSFFTDLLEKRQRKSVPFSTRLETKQLGQEMTSSKFSSVEAQISNSATNPTCLDTKAVTADNRGERDFDQQMTEAISPVPSAKETSSSSPVQSYETPTRDSGIESMIDLRLTRDSLIDLRSSTKLALGSKRTSHGHVEEWFSSKAPKRQRTNVEAEQQHNDRIQRLLELEKQERAEFEQLASVRSMISTIRDKIQTLYGELDELILKETKTTDKMEKIRSVRLEILNEAYFSTVSIDLSNHSHILLSHEQAPSSSHCSSAEPSNSMTTAIELRVSSIDSSSFRLSATSAAGVMDSTTVSSLLKHPIPTAAVVPSLLSVNNDLESGSTDPLSVPSSANDKISSTSVSLPISETMLELPVSSPPETLSQCNVSKSLESHLTDSSTLTTTVKKNAPLWTNVTKSQIDFDEIKIEQDIEDNGSVDSNLAHTSKGSERRPSNKGDSSHRVSKHDHKTATVPGEKKKSKITPSSFGNNPFGSASNSSESHPFSSALNSSRNNPFSSASNSSGNNSTISATNPSGNNPFSSASHRARDKVSTHKGDKSSSLKIKAGHSTGNESKSKRASSSFSKSKGSHNTTSSQTPQSSKKKKKKNMKKPNESNSSQTSAGKKGLNPKGSHNTTSSQTPPSSKKKKKRNMKKRNKSISPQNSTGKKQRNSKGALSKNHSRSKFSSPTPNKTNARGHTCSSKQRKLKKNKTFVNKGPSNDNDSCKIDRRNSNKRAPESVDLTQGTVPTLIYSTFENLNDVNFSDEHKWNLNSIVKSENIDLSNNPDKVDFSNKAPGDRDLKTVMDELSTKKIKVETDDSGSSGWDKFIRTARRKRVIDEYPQLTSTEARVLTSYYTSDEEIDAAVKKLLFKKRKSVKRLSQNKVAKSVTKKTDSVNKNCTSLALSSLPGAYQEPVKPKSDTTQTAEHEKGEESGSGAPRKLACSLPDYIAITPASYK